MRALFIKLFGEGRDLEWWQMSTRAAAIFFATLALIRIAGRRSFGMRSPFDNTITILLGAILSRAVVGASEVVPTLTAALVLVLLHRIFAWIAMRSRLMGGLLKGEREPLYENGSVNEPNLRRNAISINDLLEGVRECANVATLDQIDAAYLECSGKISVVKRPRGGE